MRFFRILSAPSAALLVAMCAPGAFASALAPLSANSSVTLTSSNDVTEGGTLVATISNIPYNLGTGDAAGTVTESVYSAAGSGDLDFVYQFTNTVSTDGIASLEVSNFGSFITNVGYDTTDPGTGSFTQFSVPNGNSPDPDDADRTISGNTVTFQFSPAEAGSAETAMLIVSTNATTYTSGTVGVIDNGTQTLYGFLAPAPEPAEAGVLLGGLLAAGLFVARKFRVQRS